MDIYTSINIFSTSTNFGSYIPISFQRVFYFLREKKRGTINTMNPPILRRNVGARHFKKESFFNISELQINVLLILKARDHFTGEIYIRS